MSYKASTDNLRNLKNMFCGKCGTQLSDTDKFCPRCGEKVQPVSEEKEAPSNNQSNKNVHESFQSINSSTITNASNQKPGTLKKSIFDYDFIKFIIPAILLTITFCLKCAKNNTTESSSEQDKATSTSTTSTTNAAATNNYNSTYPSENYTQSQDYRDEPSNEVVIGAWHGSLPGMSGLTWRFYDDGTLKVSASGQFIGYGTYKMINDYKVVVTCFDMSLEFRILSPGQMETSNGIILTK